MNNSETSAVRELSDIELDQVSGGDTCTCGCGVEAAGAVNSLGTIYVSLCGGLYNLVGGHVVPLTD